MSELTIDSKKLVDVLSVLDLVPIRPGIAASVFVEITPYKNELTIKLSSDVSGVVWVKGTGDLKKKDAFYLDRRLFFPFVFSAKSYRSDKPFVIKLVEKQALISQGRRKAKFDCYAQNAGYALLPGQDGTTLKVSKELSDMMTLAKEFATPDPTVPELNCVYIHATSVGGALYSSNQMIFFRAGFKTKEKMQDIAFPLFLIPLLGHERIKTVRIRKKDVVFDFDCGMIWQMVSVKASKNFPLDRINKLFDEVRSKEEVFKMKTHLFGAVTNRFAEYLTTIRRQDWLMHVKGTSGDKQVTLEVQIPQGVFREKVGIENALDDDLLIDWPLDSLFPVFQHVAKDKEGLLAVNFAKKTPYLLSAGRMKVLVARRKK